MPEDRIPLDQNQQEQKRGKAQSEISAFPGTESQDRITEQNQQEQKRGKAQSEISAFPGTESQDRNHRNRSVTTYCKPEYQPTPTGKGVDPTPAGVPAPCFG